MDTEFDVNKIAANYVEQTTDRVLSAAASGVKGVTTHVRARLGRTYRTYIERLLERHGKGKSFFVRTEPIPLYEFFVPLDLSTQVRTLERPAAYDLASVSQFSIITGSGGSGKSMMMRHLLVSSIVGSLKTPIFLELRQLNQTTDTVRAALLESLKSGGLEADTAFLDQALESGQFLILLDGFDEVEHSSRKRVAREIQQIAHRYPNNWFVMSSRPDSALQGWEEFTEFRVEPLDLDSAVDLVEKLPFDKPIKDRFIKDVRASLFEKHSSFLSNPLLLSIMLLTYSDVAHIPHKLSTFYSQAYEALFHRHDALKSGFQRERRTGLDIQDYGRAFAAFSLLSYDKREFSFTYERALEVIAQARGAAMLPFDDRAFLDDAIQAICLLLEDGMEIAFAHRSFQEYFVARFIHSSPPDVKAKLVQRFAPTVQADSVMALLWEIDPYIVERHYLLPKLAELRKAIALKTKAGPTHLARYMALVYTDIRIPTEEPGRMSATIGNEPLHTAAYFAIRRYRSEFPALSQEERDRISMQMRATFSADYGEGTIIPTGNLKLRGKFLRFLAKDGMFWSLAFLRSLFEIEREILRKHAQNRESLEQVLALQRPQRSG
jgi:hypothetical protein